MIRHSFRKMNTPQSGQTTVLVLTVLGIFLLGLVAFAVDYAHAYYRRQNAQGAADAACTAGIMDLLANSTGNSLGNFPTGSPPAAFQCSANTTTAACKYAALNGYSAVGLTANTPSDDVKISFPSSVPGITPPPSGLAPTPFLQVDVTDRSPTWFAGLVTGSRTVDVGAKAVCALQQAKAPVPIIVLNPTCNQAFDVSGSASVSIIGGPSRSIQVNSNNQSCAAGTTSGNGCTGSGTIDLSQGGPTFNGGSFGVFGAPTSAPSGFNGGTLPGKWTPAAPIGDPYSLVAAPVRPTSAAPAPTPVLYNVNGCPDHGGCTEYHPGLYSSAIVVKGFTAIFDPGVYYIEGTNNDNCGSPSSCNTKPTGQCRYGLDVDSLGVVRPANLASSGGYGSGTVFYMSGASGSGSFGSVFFGSNAGKTGGRNVDPFNTSNFTCPGGTVPPTQLNLPATVSGDILLGQCTGGGTWLGASINGTAETSGTIRGLIFFQDRANADSHGQASMQGGGGLVISGNLYFHNCNSSGTGTGCSNPTTGYNAFLQLQGSPGAGTYVLGNITADSFVLSGNGGVAMALNPNAVYNILKASLIQ